METKPQRLARLLAIAIVGNAHDDRDVLALSHEIAMDESDTMENRIAALRRMDEAMGVDEVCNELSVRDYVEQATADAAEGEAIKEAGYDPAIRRVHDELMQQLDAESNAIGNLIDGDDEADDIDRPSQRFHE